jgi:hypothetical protein
MLRRCAVGFRDGSKPEAASVYRAPRHDSGRYLAGVCGDCGGLYRLGSAAALSAGLYQPGLCRRCVRVPGPSRAPHRPAIEPRKPLSPGCRRCFERGRQHEQAHHRERLVGPAWSKNLACAEAPYTGTGRSHVWPVAAYGTGPHREGEESWSPSPISGTSCSA